MPSSHTDLPSGIVTVARSVERYEEVLDLAGMEQDERDSLSRDVPPENLPPGNRRSFHNIHHAKRRVAIVVLLIMTIVLVPAYAEQSFTGNKIARGVSLGNVDLGGKSVADARSIFSRTTKKALSTPMVFTLGAKTISVLPSDIDLKFNVNASVDKASDVGKSFNPTRVVSEFFTRYFSDRNVDPIVSYNPTKFDDVAQSMVTTFSKGHADAGVSITGTQVKVIKPRTGKGVSIDQARSQLNTAVHSVVRKEKQLTNENVRARITLAEAQKVASTIRTMLSTNSVLTTPAGNTITITPEQLAAALVVTPEKSKLVLSIDEVIMRGSIAAQLEPVEIRPQDATWTANGNAVTVVPSVPGKKIDFPAAIKLWEKGEHNFTAALVDIIPEHDTQWAQKLNITEVVSSFTTNFPAGQERIKNIRRAAEVVNNTVLQPGETFSLNDTLGKRTAESGYVIAPVYQEGQGLVEDYGGGASQFSTTLFNAAWVGGFKNITHTPHSIYIPRYPLGREATLNFGTIDMKFQNNSSSGMVIKTYVGATSVSVTLYGNKEGRTVRLEGPNKLSEIPMTTDYTDDPTLEAGKEKETAHGYTGIVVENYRTVDFPGRPGKRETLRWTYQMVPRKALRGTKPVTP